jgi:hypothetical protein
MDIDKLKVEILSGTPEAALPCNLSDHWLSEVGASLEQVLEVAGEESRRYMVGPLLLILHILRGKTGSEEIRVSEDELFERFVDYRMEIALEEVNRRTDIKCTSATLKTIFTNRSVMSSLK